MIPATIDKEKSIEKFNKEFSLFDWKRTSKITASISFKMFKDKGDTMKKLLIQILAYFYYHHSIEILLPNFLRDK
jgi:hypothetical protein